MRFLSFVILSALIAAGLCQDHCNQFPTCDTCVASPYCGWCSNIVQYKSGAKGYHCAGFNDNGSNPFVCNGIYSTNQCLRGYVCNNATFQCELTVPGGGESLATCQSECSTVGKTFICNNKTHQCDVAPAGQGTSFEICEQSCSSNHTTAPASASPASGSPSSPQPQPPHSTAAPTYVCNATTLKCDMASPGEGSSLIVCEANCKSSNHTPTALLGLWRSFPIDSTTPLDEYDIDFHKNATVTIYTRQFNSICNVQTVGPQLWFTDCVAPEPSTLKCIWETSLTMPETYHAMLACNHGSGPAPSSMISALSQNDTSVVFMSQCVPERNCIFHAGGFSSPRARVNIEKRLRKPAVPLKFSDPCTQYGANCSYCISHALCGWCSTNVQYSDNTTGNQCAGFNSDPNKKNDFTCTGSYSTEMCLPGFTCEASNQTCVPTIPGSGVPFSDCNASCHAKPGPPSTLIGDWRGLFIQHDYTVGAVEADITSSGIKVYFVAGKAKDLIFSGTLKHIGADVFINVTDGPNRGSTLSGIYVNEQNEVVEYIELAVGGANANLPTNFSAAMTKPNQELILAKCAASTCKF
jgi:hypothetical protein